MRGGPVGGDDGRARCPWGDSPVEYRRYHDEEWGRPVGDEARIFEKLSLEAFQAGLSWLTILRKRAAFRAAFAGFDPEAVAEFGSADVARLLADRTIVRNRAKVAAVIANAGAVLRLREESRSLGALVWAHEPRLHRVPRRLDAVPASIPEAAALAVELRGHGFRFLGPTTVYAAMQALGVVNDHLVGCSFREEAAAERSRFRPPR